MTFFLLEGHLFFVVFKRMPAFKNRKSLNFFTMFVMKVGEGLE